MQFGNQCIVVAIDAKQYGTEDRWLVYTHGGRKPTKLDVVEWAQEVVQRGAGEILLSVWIVMAFKDGYDIPLN